MVNYLFLDIDGVLNSHKWNELAGSCTIEKENLRYLNEIVLNFNPRIVISSAWRYHILNGDMSLNGFKWMLRAFGLVRSANIFGFTECDRTGIDYGKPNEGIKERRFQILYWLVNNVPAWPSRDYHESKIVILDDLPLGPVELITPKKGVEFVQTNPEVGLCFEDYRKIESFFKGSAAL